MTRTREIPNVNFYTRHKCNLEEVAKKGFPKMGSDERGRDYTIRYCNKESLQLIATSVNLSTTRVSQLIRSYIKAVLAASKSEKNRMTEVRKIISVRSKKCHEKSDVEVSQAFLHTVSDLVDAWDAANIKGNKLEGLAKDILAVLDGCNETIPGFLVAPLPNPEDKKLNKSEGNDWYPENHKAKVKCDIAGGLHEEFTRMRK